MQLLFCSGWHINLASHWQEVHVTLFVPWLFYSCQCGCSPQNINFLFRSDNEEREKMFSLFISLPEVSLRTNEWKCVAVLRRKKTYIDFLSTMSFQHVSDHCSPHLLFFFKICKLFHAMIVLGKNIEEYFHCFFDSFETNVLLGWLTAKARERRTFLNYFVSWIRDLNTEHWLLWKNTTSSTTNSFDSLSY